MEKNYGRNLVLSILLAAISMILLNISIHYVEKLPPTEVSPDLIFQIVPFDYSYSIIAEAALVLSIIVFATYIIRNVKWEKLPYYFLCIAEYYALRAILITLNPLQNPYPSEDFGIFHWFMSNNGMFPSGHTGMAFLTFFFDTAAVFEEKRIFGAIHRSLELVTAQSVRVLKFYIISAAVFFGITLSLMIVWEAALYDKLEPLSRFNETQIAEFTPDQLAGIIGADGIVITAICLFFGFLVLLPILSTYKACFFRTLNKGSISIEQQITGEYDSKGRWYKY